MANTNESQSPDDKITKPGRRWWTRFVGNVEGKIQQRKSKKENETPTDRAARRTANATIWMAIFTFILAVTSAVTICVLINQLSEARDEQRAWVGVQESVSKDFSETVPWTVTVVFFNSGRTPARNVQSSRMYKTSRVPLSGPPDEDIRRLQFRPAQSIAPEGRYLQVMGGGPAAEPTTSFQQQGVQELISEYPYIKNKTLHLYYFGVLKYDDVLGNHRETKFCILLANPDTKESGFCDEFNDLN